MKRNNKIKKVMTFLLAAGGLGCAGTARSKATVESKLAEESRALTTAIVETLQLQPSENNDQFSAVALQFAKQDQRVEGLPLNIINVDALLGTNATSKAIETKEVAERFASQNELLGRQRKLEEKLVELGAVAEEKTARRTRFWAKWISGGTLLIGGIVALCVFFPVVIPIVGRILAWLVGKLPGLAGAVGVVGVKAFDGIVRGIEMARKPGAGVHNPGEPSGLASRTGFHNQRSSNETDHPNRSWIERLETNLSKAMDSDHKRLVKSRKVAVA